MASAKTEVTHSVHHNKAALQAHVWNCAPYLPPGGLLIQQENSVVHSIWISRDRDS